MSAHYTFLLLEDEPVVLMDLADAAEDRGCTTHLASSASAAIKVLKDHGGEIDVAVLDVSLGADDTCLPVAHQLDALRIPYLIYTGDLDRHDEQVRELEADIIAKPTPADRVIAAAIVLSETSKAPDTKIAAE